MQPKLGTLEPLTPVYTVELFAPLHEELISLLRGLSAEDWLRPSVAQRWRVRDIAAHLLDGDLRRLAAGRDGHPLSTKPVAGYADVFALIQELNAGGVQFGQRLSPRLLTDLLAVTGPWVAAHFTQLPPHDEATFPVDWAGETRSEHWMDIGRDYTERWHHQMQIRDAVGAPPLFAPRWLFPLLDLSVRALPRGYAHTPAPDGSNVLFDVEGPSPMAWSLIREGAAWVVKRGRAECPDLHLRLDADTAWKLFYNALTPAESQRRVSMEGNQRLAVPLLATRSVMV